MTKRLKGKFSHRAEWFHHNPHLQFFANKLNSLKKWHFCKILTCNYKNNGKITFLLAPPSETALLLLYCPSKENIVWRILKNIRRLPWRRNLPKYKHMSWLSRVDRKRKTLRVANVKSGKCCVWKGECGKCGVWKIWSAENRCGKCGVWKIRSVVSVTTHSAFSTLLIFHIRHFPHSAFSTLFIFHTLYSPHSSFST